MRVVRGGEGWSLLLCEYEYVCEHSNYRSLMQIIVSFIGLFCKQTRQHTAPHCEYEYVRAVNRFAIFQLGPQNVVREFDQLIRLAS